MGLQPSRVRAETKASSTDSLTLLINLLYNQCERCCYFWYERVAAKYSIFLFALSARDGPLRTSHPIMHGYIMRISTREQGSHFHTTAGRQQAVVVAAPCSSYLLASISI